MSLTVVEDLSLLSPYKDKHKFENVNEFHLNTLLGNYEYAISLLPELGGFLKHIEEGNFCSPFPEFDSNISLLLVAVCVLEYFVSLNWTGPNKIEDFNSSSSNNDEFVNDLLTIDHEPIVRPPVKPSLLYFCKTVFLQQQYVCYHSEKAFKWWRMRYALVHISLLEQPVPSLSEFICDIPDLSADFRVLFYLELSYAYYTCLRWSHGNDCLNKALSLSGLKISLTGALGKRTRYQTFEIPQLSLNVDCGDSRTAAENNSIDKCSNEVGHGHGHGDGDGEKKVPCRAPSMKNPYISEFWEKSEKLVPTNITLDDDVLLDTVEFKDEVKSEQLTALQELVLLGALNDFRRNTPRHSAVDDEISMAYLSKILERESCWAIHTSALWIRTLLEKWNHRRLERALLQLENLFENITDERPSAAVRLPYFYATCFPSVWELRKALAEFYRELGMFEEGLKHYLCLKNWEGVVLMYRLMGKSGHAAEILRQQIKIKPTPDLYCTLGEVTGETELFDKAFELSKGSNARSQRLLGKFLFKQAKYEEAVKYLENSVRLNPAQYDGWFLLGTAAFRAKLWRKGAEAFQRCCMLENEDFSVWNNLAACLIKLGQKERAQKILRNDAVRLDYENWRVWENLLWVSVDCRVWEDVILSFNRLIDLRDQYFDEQAAEVLVKSVSELLVQESSAESNEKCCCEADLSSEKTSQTKEKMSNGKNEKQKRKRSAQLFDDTKKLLARMFVCDSSNFRISELYADLLKSSIHLNFDIDYEICKLYQKSLGAFVSKEGFECSESRCSKGLCLVEKSLEQCNKLLLEYKDKSVDTYKELVLSSKLSSFSLLCRIRRYNCENEKIVAKCDEFSRSLDEIMRKLSKSSSS